MAMTRLEKLISIAGPPTLPSPPSTHHEPLLQMLAQKNGFYAFESALHVFGAGSPAKDRSLEQWNASSLWRDQYEGLSPNAVFFAEDIFGVQFCLLDGSISTFDPETGALEHVAADLEAWAAAVLDDYEVLTGYPIAHEWQAANGALPFGHRLVPKIPFVLGGDFSIANVHSLDAVKGMHFRASVAAQIRDLPDGATVTLNVVD